MANEILFLLNTPVVQVIQQSKYPFKTPSQISVLLLQAGDLLANPVNPMSHSFLPMPVEERPAWRPALLRLMKSVVTKGYPETARMLNVVKSFLSFENFHCLRFIFWCRIFLYSRHF